ncbi:MAG: DUF3047 domain-containing protein [Bdellovibrionales bacterium]|nr:DUF3047 domain-containing protein [Ramlibacter sp.]
MLPALAQIVACSTTGAHSGDDAALRLTPWATRSSHTSETSAWQHFKLPGKVASTFTYTRMDGRDAMAVMAVSSASMLRDVVRIEPAELDSVRFSWKVPELIAGADMALRESDDSPVRIVLAFEGDRSRFSPKNAMLSELSLALTGEKMPYATLMYVWCNNREPDSVIINPRSDRIRKLVVQSGPRQLNQWLDYERNIRKDYERAFGEPPGALVAIGIMTDSDNTHSTARAWYGPVRLTRSSASSR